MHITVSNEATGDLLGPFELSDDMKLMDFMALIDFQEHNHILWHNMKQLGVNQKQKTLKELGLTDNDLVLLRTRDPAAQSSGGEFQENRNVSDEEYIDSFRRSLQNNASLRANIPIPGIDLLVEDAQLFKQLLGPALLQRRTQVQAQNPFGISQEEYSRLMSNPDDPENQSRISELIAQQEIDEQLRSAMEYTPEVFTSVHMLYINLEINDHPVKAFVDSGAQSTIMSTGLAEKTGLTRLIDKRFRGVAMGVGKREIIGKIHTTQIKIESQFIPCSFTVLDTNVDMLLGLDMLKRYQACIDLKNNVLRIAEVEAPFLSESEIPKEFEAQVKKQLDPTIPKPMSAPSGYPQIEQVPESSGVATTNSRNYPEAVVKRLIDLGFQKEEVIRALDQANGNADYAAAILFQ
ncbi:Ddi1p Ecym_6187 [Eremothecium cymbalariae DBVPG|uniref:DNA damage-inducible protein 1 n=1 Tax=Eremothecium cymbalariae (strain CBS 270.75 / DBVPG 7215 / KCTC 17166 / NRRL Y-17582) TaxID=931890 RepID=G8JV91_ERECY|nr:hypothetical protein Ecym_6187 [Eremothecium cymbalariae DBVPG\